MPNYRAGTAKRNSDRDSGTKNGRTGCDQSTGDIKTGIYSTSATLNPSTGAELSVRRMANMPTSAEASNSGEDLRSSIRTEHS